MEELFVRLLYEDWDDKKYRIKSTSRSGVAKSGTGNSLTSGAASSGIIKGSLTWFRDLQAFCDRMEWNLIPRDSILLNPRQFVEGIQDGQTGVFDRSEEKSPESGAVSQGTSQRVLLMDSKAIERYIRQNPSVSIQSKIDMLNSRLYIKIKDEFLGKGVKYTAAEKKAIVKAYRGRFGARTWKRSIYDIYQEFLQQQAAKV